MIQLKRVHVQNFRSLKDAVIELESLSILFGKNDAGKSNLLYALKLAFNGGSINDEDVFSSPEYQFSREKSISIDLLFIPINESGQRIKSFDDLWSMHFGENVSVDFDENEFFAFRAEYTYDKDKQDYVWERKRIDSWNGNDIQAGKGIGFRTLSAFDYILLNAQRDIALDIRDKTSLWNKEVAKMQISEEVKSEIENSLYVIGSKIKSGSLFLQNVEEDLSYVINNEKSKIDVSPIARNVNELYKGLDIYVAPESSSSFSISNLGLGTRSKAVFSILKTIIKKRMQASQIIPYFCILALEEPEAHIYPHSQRQLIQNLVQTEGQKIVTTHSPYLLTASSINSLINVSLNNCESRYISLSGVNLEKEDLRNIDRFVLNNRGDILFSKVTILAEGETEEKALSVFFQEYFGKAIFELGVNIIGVDGNGKNYLPFLQILEAINIRWFIFSDGEADTITKLQKTIQALQNTHENVDVLKMNNIIILQNHNFESYLVESGYKNEIIMAINEFEDESKEDYFLPFFESYKKRRFEIKQEDEDRVLLKCMKDGKVKYAEIIAQTICKQNNGKKRLPPKIRELMEKIKSVMAEKNDTIT